MVTRARAYITADAREQTAWGTARAYVAVGVITTDTGNTQIPSITGFNRAFIQWAGITAGITQSFFDFYLHGAVAYRYYVPSEDSGDGGWWLWAYTAQLGNGLSASISAEARRITQMINLSGNSELTATGTNITGLTNLATSLCGVAAQPGSLTGDLASAVAANSGPYGGMQSPDIVGNIRLDQTWGSAQIMAAAHEDNAGYYGQTVSSTVSNGIPGTYFGHPGDKWGFVVGAGLRLNFPMIAQGDYFQGEVNYTQGALRYLDHTGNAPTLFYERGNGAAYGLMSDCVYGATVHQASAATQPSTLAVLTNQTGCQLTTGWSFNASYEHYWTPQFRESFFGGYMAVRYNTQANNMLCAYTADGGIHADFGTAATPQAGCNNNWNIWSVGTRFQYDFTKTLYIGAEFLYQGLDTATGLGGANNNTLGSILAGQFNTATTTSGINSNTPLKDMQNLAVTVRIHKDFLP